MVARKVKRVITIVGLAISLIILWRAEVVASEPVKVAILDSGSNIGYKEGISLIDATVKDYNGHGTLMARIVREVYPQAELYIIKVIGKDGLAINEEAVILGLEWAISRGVDVINISLRLKDSERLHKAIKKASSKGVVIVVAAGNKNSVISYQLSVIRETLNSKNTTSDIEVAYPARYDEVIAVGALDRYGRVYKASLKGEGVDIYCKGYRGEKAGTSIASVYATGMIARIISENPDFNIEELKDFMRQQTKVRR
jgi:subtilisin family serine protease